MPSPASARAGGICYYHPLMDRRLARKNLRTALISGAVSLLVFAASFVAAYIY